MKTIIETQQILEGVLGNYLNFISKERGYIFDSYNSSKSTFVFWNGEKWSGPTPKGKKMVVKVKIYNPTNGTENYNPSASYAKLQIVESDDKFQDEKGKSTWTNYPIVGKELDMDIRLAQDILF